MNWKVWIRTNEPKWYTNAMEYATKELAEEAALDLSSRWLSVSDWTVRPLDVNPNVEVVQ